MPIDQVMDEGVRLQTAQHNAKVRQNRETVKRLINATAYLGMQELSFRGHDEGADSDNNSSLFTGMSKTIQNDLISAISKTYIFPDFPELD